MTRNHTQTLIRTPIFLLPINKVILLLVSRARKNVAMSWKKIKIMLKLQEVAVIVISIGISKGKSPTPENHVNVGLAIIVRKRTV
jgi:hypothetical protein